MTSHTLIFSLLLCSMFVPNLGQNITALLSAFIRFSVAYESNQAYAANQSYYAYSSSNLASYLQSGQHGSNTKTENISLASSYLLDLALLTNAQTLADLSYDGELGFNEFVDVAKDFVCVPTDCSHIPNSGIYRTLNGTCNNLEVNPLWGAAFTAQQRSDKNLRGHWEKMSTTQYTLDRLPGYQFDTRAIGAAPKFDERAFIFKLKGDAAVRLSVFSTANKSSISIKCSGDPCVADVEGAIFRVKNIGQCKVGEEIFFKENSNTFSVTSDDCKDNSYEVEYYQFLADVYIQPESSSSNHILALPDGSEDVSADHKFGSDEFARYWMNIDDNGGIAISEGTEFSDTRVFMDATLSLGSNPNLKKLFVTVGVAPTSASVSTTAEFVNRDTYEVCTDGSTPVDSTNYGVVDTLETIPFTYDYYVFRWGINTANNAHFDVILTSTQDTNLTLRVDFGDKAASDLSYSGSAQQEVADYTSIQSVNFETGAGELYRSYDAFYLAWHDSYMYFGYGNQIGKNLITTQALNMTDLTRFVVKNVTISSEREACWVVDIEQPNVPRQNSLSTGEDLPSAMDVAMLIHSNSGEQKFSTEVTLATFQWGQFIDHVFIATPLSTIGGHAPICCNGNRFVTDDSYSEEFCLEIPINNNILTDAELGPFYTEEGGTECMDFVRSAIAISCDGDDVDLRVREQMNAIPSLIDASNVYGSSDAEANALRDADSAKLHIQHNVFNNQVEMPNATTAGEACAVANVVKNLTVDGVTKEVKINCNHGGDFRSQEQSSLAAIHTLFVREHNRLVDELKAHGYDDSTPAGREELFQVVRHIISGMMQVITYQAWLPSFLSDATLQKYKITNTGCSYNPDKIKAAFKNLVGLVFRYGHTWITNDLAGNVDVINHLAAYDSLPLFTDYFNSTASYGNGSDPVMNNWIKPCGHTDGIMEDAVIHNLFQNLNPSQLGLNLAALNVQRGRDHGVPTYKRTHEIFEKNSAFVPQSIDDIAALNLTDSDTLTKLRRLYHSIEDIDIFTGAVMEHPLDSTTSVGKVINEALGDMFNILRRGDRFWYECYFSNDARRELRKMTLGRMMCDNVDSFTLAQRDMFRVASSSNPNVTCSDRESMDLSYFSKSNFGGRNLERFPNQSTSQAGASTRETDLDKLLDFLRNLLVEKDSS